MELEEHRKLCNEYVREIKCSRCGDMVKNTMLQ
jgi:hypothetical protein